MIRGFLARIERIAPWSVGSHGVFDFWGEIPEGLGEGRAEVPVSDHSRESAPRLLSPKS